MTDDETLELLARRNPVREALRDELARRVAELRAQLPPLVPPPQRPPTSWRRLGSRLRAPALAAGVAAVLLVALTIAAPWRGGPTILDRAAAAILSPAANRMLYESIAIRPSISGGRGGVTHVRVWVDGASPKRFRVTFDGPQPGDIGGRLGGVTGLSYAVSDGVLDPVVFYRPVTQSALDPAAFIKAALTSGRARLDGSTTLRGGRVLRIELTATRSGEPIAVYFVDAHTYRPVRIALLAAVPVDPVRLGFPLASLSFLPSAISLGFAPHEGRYGFVCDFSEYRYVTPEPANRKLANIRAAHPNAKIV